MTTRETPVLLLHGFWHGAWCWSEVLGRLTAAGTRALAVDMAGHGLRARRPAAPTARPFDPAALAAEPSPAGTGLDEAAALFIAQARALGGGAPVTAVAHSMGGNVLTRAVQQAPGLFAHAVYVTAFMPASGVPAAAYIFAPENEGDLVGVAMVADPAAIGALRLDTASPDPSYRQLLRDCFFGDVGSAVADAAIGLLAPDAPPASPPGRPRSPPPAGARSRARTPCARRTARCSRPCSASSSSSPTPPSRTAPPPCTPSTPRTPPSCRCQASLPASSSSPDPAAP
jgi:pimeloyl-ACP methyl ester carboxylesterase